jgi:hypothetical protein
VIANVFIAFDTVSTLAYSKYYCVDRHGFDHFTARIIRNALG